MFFKSSQTVCWGYVGKLGLHSADECLVKRTYCDGSQQTCNYRHVQRCTPTTKPVSPKRCVYVPIYSRKNILNCLIQAAGAFSITVLEKQIGFMFCITVRDLLALVWMVKTDRWMLSALHIKPDICGLFVFESAHEVAELFVCLFFTLNIFT